MLRSHSDKIILGHLPHRRFRREQVSIQPAQSLSQKPRSVCLWNCWRVRLAQKVTSSMGLDYLGAWALRPPFRSRRQTNRPVSTLKIQLWSITLPSLWLKEAPSHWQVHGRPWHGKSDGTNDVVSSSRRQTISTPPIDKTNFWQLYRERKLSRAKSWTRHSFLALQRSKMARLKMAISVMSYIIAPTMSHQNDRSCVSSLW